MPGPAKSVAIVGCGAIGSFVARKIHEGVAGAYRISGIYAGPDAGARLSEFATAVAAEAFHNLDDLLATRPEYVVEATMPSVARQIVPPCLRRGAHVLVLSTGAFADPAFYETVMTTAAVAGRKVYLLSGAIAGLDFVQAAALDGALAVHMRTEKPPAALNGAPGLKGQTLPDNRLVEAFRGTGSEAVAAFPRNVNVLATLGLAAGALERVTTSIVSNPRSVSNLHSITVEGRVGKARFDIDTSPFSDNPKSSMIAGYSVLAKLRALASPIEIG
jgi:aspartate dehydrogenase